VPLLNTIAPLSPFDAAFAVRSVIEPDDDTEPAPLDTCTRPPVLLDDVVEPAYTYTSPPTPLFVVPTATEIEPARPELASPVDTIT
jgi:hypothetical protein